jgi:hypothetical protein
VRHVRMLGLCLVAVFAVSAVFAASALAAKDPWSVNTWGQFKHCPYENTEPEVKDCFYGRTEGGKEGGEFQYGRITVKLKHPVVIQGAFKRNHELGLLEVLPELKEGGETLEDTEPEPIVKGLKVITPAIQEEAEWPAALMESYAAAKSAKTLNKASVKIEMAGNECYEVPGCLNTEHLLEEEGEAFRLSLKVTVHNAWLESLGGGPCTIGSDENPIKQLLTSGEFGRPGEVTFNETFTVTSVANSKLVDTSWHIPKAAGATGCGNAEWESYIDKAMNIALEVEDSEGEEWINKTGLTWLKGDLYDGVKKAVAKLGVESGELP